MLAMRKQRFLLQDHSAVSAPKQQQFGPDWTKLQGARFGIITREDC
jgi:hypothetical protein